jgi:Meckel syndrome type 1 protein
MAGPDQPAWGRDKTPGTPAAPALANANPKAELAEKAAARADAGAPSTATPPEEPAPPELPAAAVENGLAAHAERQPSLARRTEKAEKPKAHADAAVDAERPAAAPPDKPAPIRPVHPAARPAAVQAEAPEARPEHARPAPDAPDAAAAADSHAAPQATAAPPLAPAHVVRGSPETVAALAAQIVKKLEGRSTRFDVELDPAGLGKVDVRVEIGAHGRLTAAMTCDNPNAASELRARAPELQRALEQAGFDLSGGLSFDVAGDSSQGQPRQDQGRDDGAFRGHAFRAALDSAEDASSAATQGALKLRRGGASGLDLRI